MKKIFLITILLLSTTLFAFDIRTDCINKSYTGYITEGLYSTFIKQSTSHDQLVKNVVTDLLESGCFNVQENEIDSGTFIKIKEKNGTHYKIVRTLLNIEKEYNLKIDCAKYF